MSDRPTDGGWTERIARARHLARERASTSQVLGFYAELATFQQSLVPVGFRPTAAASFVESIDREAILALLPTLLSWLRRSAPTRLAEAAIGMRQEDPAAWRDLIEAYWTRDEHDVGDIDETRVFVVEALLQPFAEALASVRLVDRSKDGRRCPLCTGKPVVGTLREEGHGARRSLVCGLCFTEWPSLRVMCLACGEGRFDALSVYRADEFSGARVDACDTCHTYLKTIDFTQNVEAVPIVDDLASLPLDLWARERGYTKLRPNLLRM